MKTKLNWKKGIFSSTYSIFKGATKVGELKDQTFSKKASGVLNGKKYRFKSKGVFLTETQIIDGENNEAIGTIVYNSWGSKASVFIGGKKYHFHYNNIWNTKWSIFHTDGKLVNFSCKSTKGNLESKVGEELLVLTGIFIANFFKQVMLGVFIAFTPIWIAIFW